MLKDLEKLFTWARMRFKPTKSRSLVIRKGKLEKVVFRISNQPILNQEKPIKCLRKWFNGRMCDTKSITEMRQQTKEWLDSVDKSGLPGSYKAWCYQHGILLRLTWPLFIYDVPLSTAEVLERTISIYLRRWLNVPRSLSSIGLYSTGYWLLPLPSLVEKYKVAKVRQVVKLRDSNDKYVSGAGIKPRSGRKWQVEEAVNLTEERL